MKLGKFVRLLPLAAPVILLASCSDDPTDEGSGEAFAIISSVSSTTRAVGAAFTVTAQVIDRAGTPLPQQVNATSAKTDVVALDSSRYVIELQQTTLYLRTLKVDASAPIVLNASSLTDTVEVRVLTGPFPGTVATAAALGGTVVQFTSATNLFDANTAVDVTTSEPGFLVDVTPTRVRYLLPFGSASATVPYAITGAGPADFSLAGTFNAPTVACADGNEPNNTPATANATALVPGTPAFGSVNFTTDPDDWYRFTISTAGSYRVLLDWSDGADVDVYPVNSAGAAVSTAGGTAAKPEAASVNLAAGTYFIYVNMYDSAGGACTTYQVSVTRQ